MASPASSAPHGFGIGGKVPHQCVAVLSSELRIVICSLKSLTDLHEHVLMQQEQQLDGMPRGSSSSSSSARKRSSAISTPFSSASSSSTVLEANDGSLISFLDLGGSGFQSAILAAEGSSASRHAGENEQPPSLPPSSSSSSSSSSLLVEQEKPVQISPLQVLEPTFTAPLSSDAQSQQLPMKDQPEVSAVHNPPSSRSSSSESLPSSATSSRAPSFLFTIDGAEGSSDSSRGPQGPTTPGTPTTSPPPLVLSDDGVEVVVLSRLEPGFPATRYPSLAHVCHLFKDLRALVHASAGRSYAGSTVQRQTPAVPTKGARAATATATPAAPEETTPAPSRSANRTSAILSTVDLDSPRHAPLSHGANAPSRTLSHSGGSEPATPHRPSSAGISSEPSSPNKKDSLEELSFSAEPAFQSEAGLVWLGVAVVGLLPLVDGPVLILATQRRLSTYLYRSGLVPHSSIATRTRRRHSVFRFSGFLAVVVAHETFRGALGVASTAEDPAATSSTSGLHFPLRGDLSAITELVSRVRREHASLLDAFLTQANLHGCYTADITNSTQRLNAKSEHGSKVIPAWQLADSRFFWNLRLLGPFMKCGADSFCLPLMDAFISSFPTTFPVNVEGTHHSMTIDYTLVSRRSCLRQGARYHTRGSDGLGNVANFAEAEQIISVVDTSEGSKQNGLPSYAQAVTSFVLTRGSIPTLWVQPSKGMKPKPLVSYGLLQADAMSGHFQEMNLLYGGRTVCVSLIDISGTEEDLGAEFEAQARTLSSAWDGQSGMSSPTVRYVAFDFHHECKSGWHLLSKLVGTVQGDLEACGFFSDCGGTVVENQQQCGVFRVNCIDCLDRTNVVKSLFARHVAPSMLHLLARSCFGSSAIAVCEIAGPTSTAPGPKAVLFSDEFESGFKNIWADNADAMSFAYTGTGALKTDFTRTGKRNLKGIANDATNSIKRYYNQMNSDGARQSAVDLFTGQYRVEPVSFLGDEVICFRDVRRVHTHQVQEAKTGEKDDSSGTDEQQQAQTSEDVSHEHDSVMLMLDVKKRVIRELVLSTFRQRVFGCCSVLSVLLHGNRSASVEFTTQTHPRQYEFRNASDRARFARHVRATARLPLCSQPKQRLGAAVWVATWDMEGVRACPSVDDCKTLLAPTMQGERPAAVVVCIQQSQFPVYAPVTQSIRSTYGYLRMILQAALGVDFVCINVASLFPGSERSKRKTGPQISFAAVNVECHMITFVNTARVHDDAFAGLAQVTEVTACSRSPKSKTAAHVDVLSQSITSSSGRSVHVVSGVLDNKINNEATVTSLHLTDDSESSGLVGETLWVGRFNTQPVGDAVRTRSKDFAVGPSCEHAVKWDQVKGSRGSMYVHGALTTVEAFPVAPAVGGAAFVVRSVSMQ